MIGVKYISYGGKNTGYAKAARAYVLGLVAAGVPVTWEPYEPINTGLKLPSLNPFKRKNREEDDPEFAAIRGLDIPYDTVILHTVPELYSIYTENESDKALIGYTTWESNYLQTHWPELLNRLDRVLVPCTWNKDVFERSGVTVPIDVIPHCIEPLTEEREPLADVKPNLFTFYVINEWTPRKAMADLVETYLNTFTADEAVQLVIKTSANDLTATHGLAPKSRQALRGFFKSRTRPARVILEDGFVSDEQIAWLHSRGDCFVSLTHAEGWGLGTFEAAANGIPVITTGFGGQLDFLPKDLADLVDYTLVEMPPHAHYRPGSEIDTWAQADLAHASRLMREMVERHDEKKARAKTLADHVQSQFNTQKVIASLVESIAKTSPSRQPTECRVSVVIPTFDRPDMLTDAISSILEQASLPFEVIVVDDGSAPGNKARNREVCDRHPIIAYHELKENTGRSAARNYGKRLATGELIHFLDDDDAIAPSFYARMVTTYRSCKAAVTICESAPFQDAIGDARIGTPVLNRYRFMDDPMTELLWQEMAFNSCVFKRSAVSAIDFHEDLCCGEDQLFLLEATKTGASFSVLSECLAFYRNHPKNTRSHGWFLKEQEKFYHRLANLGIFVSFRPYRFLYHYGLCINLLRQRSIAAVTHFLKLFNHRFYLVSFSWRFTREKAARAKQLLVGPRLGRAIGEEEL